VTHESPPRLKYGDELGALLRAADVEVTPERLVRNAAGYKASIETAASTALWKLLLPLVVVVGLTPLVTRARRPPLPEVSNPMPAPSADALAPHVTTTASESPVPPAVREPRVLSPLRPIAQAIATSPEPAPVPSPSELPEQIRLYEEARDAGRRGEYATGIARLDELVLRFPATALRAEAELARADLLTRAGRIDDAVSALELLVADAAHSGRRGELSRTLGDLYRRSGHCDRAVEAYDRALAERLDVRVRKDVMAGRDRCTK
jgi:hypothetical protein